MCIFPLGYSDIGQNMTDVNNICRKTFIQLFLSQMTIPPNRPDSKYILLLFCP